jgi:hypothetical protein
MASVSSNFKGERYRYLKIVFWIFFYLAIIDLSVNVLFPFPKDPSITPPTFLQGYFEYGRSVEGKLDRMISNAESKSVPILGYGWIKNKKYEELPDEAGANQTLIAVYGMSHTKLLGEAIARLDKKYVIRDITAPGAPPNWSFAAYMEDRFKHKATFEILGIMTDSVPYISSTSGTTCYFDMSHPYTFPRYSVEEGRLIAQTPPYLSDEEFREYFFNPGKWEIYCNWLIINDKYYSSFLFKRSVTDNSAICRVLRRAYSEKLKEKLEKEIITNKGLNLQSQEVIALKSIVKSFAECVRERKSIPLIYIVNNEGRGDMLFRALKPVLEAYNIPYLSTHVICPPDDPRVFSGVNSHFTPAKDLELAKATIRIIEDSRSPKALN